MDGLTNVCEATSQSLDFDNYRPTHRKGKKLLAEKKRRARINNCLMRIRDIVCHGADEKETDIDKMEKAEILERTLEVLTRVRHEFDASRKMSSQNTQKAMAVKYASGFSSCAEESIRYIQNSRLVPTEVKHQLQTHLRSIAHKMETRIVEEGHPSFSHQYTPRTPSVVLAPPQVIPLSTPHLPSSSVSYMVDNGEGMARVQFSSTKNIDYHNIANTRNSYVQPSSSDVIMTTPPYVQHLSEKKPHSIPSPIHSSTPITYFDDNFKQLSPVLMNNAQQYVNSSTSFIPVMDSDQTSHCNEHKENQPQYNTNIQQISSTSSHTSSAFHKIIPHHCKSASPTSEDNSSCRQIRKLSSSSSASPSTVFSSSQYSPISPIPSPVIVHTSTMQSPSSSTSIEHPQPVYSYDGYEPVPSHPRNDTTNNSFLMPVPGKSPTEIQQQQTPIKAMDLCVKRNDSHINISPETMWRPW